MSKVACHKFRVIYISQHKENAELIATQIFSNLTKLIIIAIFTTNRRSMSIAQFNSKLLDTVELLKLSRKGITIGLFEDIVKSSSYTLKEWSKFLHLTERTIQRYKKEKRKFEPLQSERIIEITKLNFKGKKVFGSKVNFEEWMNSKIIALGNVRPIELLDSSFGIDLIIDELGRIEHGILA